MGRLFAHRQGTATEPYNTWHLIRSIVALFFAALSTLTLCAQASHPLLQRPTFNGRLIVFSYAGDLWSGTAMADMPHA